MKLLLKYWRELFIVLVISGFMYNYHSMKEEIRELSSEKVRAEEQAKEYKKTIEGLSGVIDYQNNQVLELERIAKSQEEILKEGDKKADEIEELYKEKIRKLLSESVPVDCKGSSNWMLNKVIDGEFKWSK